MPWPIGLRGAESGAFSLPSRSAMTRCSPGLSPSPPLPSGKCTHAQAEVELGAEELPGARGRRRVLVEQLLATIEDVLFIAHEELPLLIGRTEWSDEVCW